MESIEGINGTLVWYFHICPRQVWYIYHALTGEQDNDFLLLGRHMHEVFYRNRKRELLIDNTIKVDFIEEEGLIAEVKKSSKNLKSALMQLAFYLYYFKHKKGVALSGKLLIPEERKQINVELTEELERELEETFRRIREIISKPLPPPPRKIPHCKRCAYREICWI